MHLHDAVAVDERTMPNRGREAKLRDVEHLNGDLLAAALDERAQFDQETVLVPHLLRDAITVGYEAIVQRAGVRVQEVVDLVERQLKRT